MNPTNYRLKIKDLPYFTTKMLSLMLDSSIESTQVKVSRMAENGELVKLKKGYYVSKEYYLTNNSSIEYREYISSVLRKPSYLSLQYILRKYDILSEATYGFTSVTTKVTREYKNDLGSYVYKTVRPEIFVGYTSNSWGNNSYNLASKAKALFDYLYFKSATISDSVAKSGDIAEELRIKLDLLTENDKKELYEYCELINSPKMSLIISNITKYASN